ncbi:Hypothetical protein I595_3714 [Croceitalea dokdonensis DOKDO 023]|uniref:Uncharacterized protein n=1 Tax=Croceitalea dokdonensis DOKDO 023 TaxID=1300341 RepID=A0A0P7AR73_9FLAO|nr:Hypothetical protein I595_3714 [Croceitalea dokdonensis DOKDO 023]
MFTDFKSNSKGCINHAKKIGFWVSFSLKNKLSRYVFCKTVNAKISG